MLLFRKRYKTPEFLTDPIPFVYGEEPRTWVPNGDWRRLHERRFARRMEKHEKDFRKKERPSGGA